VTAFLAIVVPGLVTLAAFWIGIAFARRRRRRTEVGSAVSPAWLNEHVYDHTGDRR
jgi:hypothetical protein